jgi:hypothetical protein
MYKGVLYLLQILTLLLAARSQLGRTFRTLNIAKNHIIVIRSWVGCYGLNISSQERRDFITRQRIRCSSANSDIGLRFT